MTADAAVPARHGAVLFQVLTEREERNSVAIASNESFGGWTKTFTDPRLCAAIVDRLAFNGMIIEIRSGVSQAAGMFLSAVMPQAREPRDLPTMSRHAPASASTASVTCRSTHAIRSSTVNCANPSGICHHSSWTVQPCWSRRRRVKCRSGRAGE
ncbi:hypothetical protein RKD23_007750 [Streptomyces sp. SAI-170]